MICKNCGSVIEDNAWECPYCTIDITQEQRDEAKAEKARASQAESEAAVQMAYQQAPPVQQAPPPVYQQPAPQPRPAYQQPVQQAQPVYQQPVQQAQPVYQQPVYQQNAYQQPAVQEKAEPGLIVMSVVVPLAGIIAGVVHLGKGQKRAGMTYLFTGLGVAVGSAILTVLAYLVLIVFAVGMSQ